VGGPQNIGATMEQKSILRATILASPSLFKYGLLAPVFIYLIFFFVYPSIKMFLLSCFDPGFSLQHYARMFNKPVYLRVILITFRLSLICTLSSLLFGYPVAYLLNREESKVRTILMIFVVLPFWTSLLVRIYAWMVILGRYGVVNSFLLKLGLISDPLNLLYNTFSVTVGMVHFLLPFMIFPIYSTMTGIDRDLIKAAYNLGASPFKAFVKVFLPLSLPGVGAGILIVFILCIGFFVTPALLGGRKDVVISMLIENQVNVQLNWSFASAMGFVLLVLTLILFNISNRFLGIDRIWGGRA
jgi:putative spermidine/putrescine transport system permease protein